MLNKLSCILIIGVMTYLCLFCPLRTALGFGDFDSGSDFGDSGSDYADSGSDSSADHLQGIVGGALIIGVICLYAKHSSDKLKKEKAAAGIEEDEMLPYIRKLFTEMQEAWEKGDISSVRYGFVPDTWERFNSQLQAKNSFGETTHVRDINFGPMSVVRVQPGEKRLVTVSFQAAYNVWVTNLSGDYVQGTPGTRHEMSFNWIMEEDLYSSHCPHCGAVIDWKPGITCPYCLKKVHAEAHNWRIQEIECTAQTTINSGKNWKDPESENGRYCNPATQFDKAVSMPGSENSGIDEKIKEVLEKSGSFIE